MNKLLTVLAIVATTTSVAHAKDKADPHSFGDVVLFGFGGDISINSDKTSSGIGAVDTVKNVKKSVGDVTALADGSMKAEAATQSEVVFNLVENGLEDAFSWQVMDLADMVGNADYAALWEEKTPNINKKMSGWGSGLAPTGVLYKDLARQIKQEQRDALMSKMGVEYFAVANVIIAGEDQGVSIGGVGTSRVKPKTLTMVSVYKLGEKKPVWKGSAQGKKTDEAIKADFGNASDDDSAIIVQSIEKSLAKLKAKYAPK